MRHNALSACLLSLLLAAPAIAAEDPAKPIKSIIASVRQERDAQALKYFASEEQGKLLLGDSWEKGTDKQRQEFRDLFQTLFAKLAFPKIRQNFQNLDTILYDKPKIDGSRAEVASTLLINHPLKKQELKLKYDVVKEGKDWRVVDVTVLGDSMLAGIRDDQVQPILKEGGWDKLLTEMRKKAKELESVPLKK